MDNEQYLELFISEAEEILTTLNHRLIELEKNPTQKSLLDELFRLCHTLKGNAAAMGFEQIEKLAHAMEHILEKLRSTKMQFTYEVANCLFQGTDFLTEMTQSIQQKTKAPLDATTIISDLQNLVTKDQLQPPAVNSQIEVVPSLPNSTKKITNELKSVRVNMESLESIMNIVGQLHINKIQLSEVSKSRRDNVLANAVNEMERTINLLQEKMMQMRLLPLKYIFNNFQRLVRDDARKEGKEIKLTITGGEISLDRSILDEINDALIHILRNAISHGIELPEERLKLGKTAHGTITITAHQEQNMVIVEFKDDGYGLDAKKIRHSLKTQQLVPEEILENLSEEEILLLITLPGFSLSKQVTERAGRGVGMNVVKNKIESIGGSLMIESQIGQGTLFRLRLPISMAIIHALLIKFENEICAIPLYHIIETIKISSKLIKNTKGGEVLSYRDEILPIIRIQQRLKFNQPNNQNSELELCIVVCEINKKKLGLIVEAFVGQQEIVVKHLTGYLQHIRGYSGATILGNGRVAMILDLTTFVN